MNRAPVAALLFEPGSAPTIAAVEALAQRSGNFALSQPASDGSSWIEVLRDGLTFDVAGFGVAGPLSPGAIKHHIGLEGNLPLADTDAITLAPGPHLAGAEHLLPVVRVLANLLIDLLDLPGVIGVAWLPAQLASAPSWFARAAGAWLAGGPFPALALAAIERDGPIFTSVGLAFLIGQEFRFVARGDEPTDRDSRIALRLADWLVAHGRVEAPREVVLVGIGAVWIEPDEIGRVNVHAL